MKITGVKTHIVDTLIPEEHRVRSGAGYKLRRQAAFVELTTDEGLKGYGPCSFGSASLDLGSVASLCDNTFADALVGEDPHRIEHLWDKLYYGSILRVHGARSVGVAILSAIDIALWDLKGKALDVPIYQLLGGAFQRPRPVLLELRVLGHARGRGGPGAGVRRPGVPGVQGQGGPGGRERHRVAARDPRRGRLRGRHARGREPVLHPPPRAPRRPGAREAERTRSSRSRCSIDDVDGHAFLADKLDVRIATGENMYTRWDFLPFLRSGGAHAAGGRVALRRHQRGQADRRPGGRPPPARECRTPSPTR